MWKLHVPRQIFHVWNSKENHWNYIWKFLMKLFSCAFHTAKPVSYLSQWDSERWSYPECRKKRIKSMEKSTNVKCLVGTNRIPGYYIHNNIYALLYHIVPVFSLYLRLLSNIVLQPTRNRKGEADNTPHTPSLCGWCSGQHHSYKQ